MDHLRIESYLEKTFGMTLIGGKTLEPEAFANRVKEMLFELKTSEIKEDDFRRMKRRKYGELIRLFNDLEGTATTIIHYNDLNVDYRDLFEILESLTVQDVKEVIDTWVDEDQLAVCMVLPEEE